jgi:riboflavin synthase
MFTGIIEGPGVVKTVGSSGQGLSVTIRPEFLLRDPQEGESIAVNGVCLTATTISEGVFTVDVSPETISRSTLGALRPGSRVNLERALKLSDRLGGHLVSGHVDGVGEIIDKRSAGRFLLFSIAVSRHLERYIIEKGSVAVDGVSLTVNTCGNGAISLAVIPHTARLTTIGLRERGDKVNVEVDLIGKYIEKLLMAGRTEPEPGTSIDAGFLARHGFL